MSAATHVEPSTGDQQKMIHIVGLYKCGTSWLLHMLAAHPEVVGWREFDVLRATYAPSNSLLSLPTAALDYVRPRPQSPNWMKRRESSTPRSSDAVFREMFMGRGWIPVMGTDNQRRAENLDAGNLVELLDQLLDIGNYRLRPSTANPINPASVTDRLGVQSFRRDELLQLMEAVKDSQNTHSIPSLFFESLRSQVAAGARIATKAADQILQLSMLKAVSPGSRIIAIVRDGRDAAISAKHFEALMRKQEAPWKTDHASYLRRLMGWSMRAAKLAEHARRGELTVVRYEDLQSNFAGICSALFENLGLSANAELVAAVQTATDFATVTNGRKPGQSADHQIRKGSSGEWQDALPTSEARLAWQIAGKSLETFGYTRGGSVEESSLVLSST